MAGNVYIFNTTEIELQLILNSTVVSSTLAGVTSSNSYAPTSINLDRSSADNSGTDTFGTDNTLVVSYQSTGGGSSTYSVTIPTSTYPLQDDLTIYIFYNIVILSDTNVGSGSVINPSTPILGRNLTKEETAEITAKAKAKAR